MNQSTTDKLALPFLQPGQALKTAILLCSETVYGFGLHLKQAGRFGIQTMKRFGFSTAKIG